MDTGVNKPKIIEGNAIVRALEFKVAIKRVFVDQGVHKELDFVEYTNVVLLVLNLEVAVRGRVVYHINHVKAINQASKLLIRSGTSPGAIMKLALLDDLESRGRVGG